MITVVTIYTAFSPNKLSNVVKFLGSFRLPIAISYIHDKYNFTIPIFETVNPWLNYSCWTIIIGQEVLLHY